MSRIDAENCQAGEQDVLVSINEPDTYPANLRAGWRAVLRMAFWDIEAPMKDALGRSGEAYYPAITIEQAREIADFIRYWHAQDERVNFHVHCRAGISRSAAVALSAFDYTSAAFPRIEFASNANQLVGRRVNEALGLSADPFASLAASED